MNILMCSPTSFELVSFMQFVEQLAENKSFLEYRLNGHSIFPLVTGVGAMNTAFSIARHPRISQVHFMINAGLAGAFHAGLKPGDVVEVYKDRFADLGAEEADGTLLDLFDLELQDPNKFPFSDGWLENLNTPYDPKLNKVSALTVNRVSGTPLSIALLKDKYDAEIESMEGAGFFYTSRILNIPCVQIRAISNYVEPRNKEKWQVELAIEKLNQVLIRFVTLLTKDRYA
ncbi:MAG TPA: futalosine hydrolase [Saprospiraceae bacterium]|nr:futalosine hydrolase [Saprospiraceae bacterium]